MAILIINIKELVQVEEKPRSLVAGKAMSKIQTIQNGWLLIEGNRIKDFGNMPFQDSGSRIPDPVSRIPDSGPLIIDATGKMVFPSFCDSHTHLVYAASREIEYIDKIKGMSYEEIAKRGGGILNSAMRLHDASEDELVEQALERLNEVMMLGTGAVEIKSGYGLSVED